MISVAALAACAGAAAREETRSAPAAAAAPAWSWPETLENAQVLPADIGPDRLRDVMIGFVNALGVRCSHCHVGSGPDLSTYDFASDANAHKETARAMMRMTRAINTDHLANIEAHGDSRVTCFTCHRGSTRPLTSPPADEEG